MLTLNTIDETMVAIYHDAITAIEEAEEGCIVYFGNMVRHVKEDIATVLDMIDGARDNPDIIHPAILHAYHVENGVDPDVSTRVIEELIHRSNAAGESNRDDTGRKVVTPPLEKRAEVSTPFEAIPKQKE